MQKTKIAAVVKTAATLKADLVTIILDYTRINQKSKAIIFHSIGGERLC